MFLVREWEGEFGRQSDIENIGHPVTEVAELIICMLVIILEKVRTIYS
jgi:hypothetical protein